MRAEYRELTEAYLLNMFPVLKKEVVLKSATSHKHHLLPTAMELEETTRQGLAQNGTSWSKLIVVYV